MTSPLSLAQTFVSSLPPDQAAKLQVKRLTKVMEDPFRVFEKSIREVCETQRQLTKASEALKLNPIPVPANTLKPIQKYLEKAEAALKSAPSAPTAQPSPSTPT
jgi:hypothetical protein